MLHLHLIGHVPVARIGRVFEQKPQVYAKHGELVRHTDGVIGQGIGPHFKRRSYVAFKVFGKGGKFGGATDELANTFTGVLSMLGDSLFNFKKRVADADFFDAIKKEFKDLDDFIKENQDTFNDIADAIGFVLTGVPIYFLFFKQKVNS